MSTVSVTAAVWLSAWLAGRAGTDNVLDALGAWAPSHRILAADEQPELRELPTTEPGRPNPSQPKAAALITQLDLYAPQPFSSIFPLLRGTGEQRLEVLLPSAGDVRGLPAGTAVAAAALTAGEAVLAAAAGCVLVPQTPVADTVLWRLFLLPADYGLPHRAGLEYESLPDAEHALRRAVSQTADAVAQLGLRSSDADVRQEISRRLALSGALSWPDDCDPRALRVLAQAQQVGAILAVAAESVPDGMGVAERDRLLRPLWRAVRDAERAASGEMVRAAGPGWPTELAR